MTTAHRSQQFPATVSSVPLIDISGTFNGAMSEKLRIARQIDAACCEIGFLVITGHGACADVIERTQKVSRAFFDLPQALKRRYMAADPKSNRGFFAEGTLAAGNSTDIMTAPDFRETFKMSREEIDAADSYYASETGRRVFTPNIWPDAIEGFDAAWIEYYKAMEKVAFALMRLFALALDLPEDSFDDKIDKHMTTMSAANYPDLRQEPLPGQLRCGAHTDFGAITILKAEDKPGGLEVLTRSGEWAPVPIVPDSFIINIGDMMARWTNDRWVSNMHRVANPPRDKAVGSRRQSLVYFFHPNYDTVIECIASCKDNGVAKYAPITAHEYLLSKIGKITKIQDVRPAF
jgi:isopenicillin N synthase-like dioxygenase